MAKKNIFVVEDEEDILDLIRHNLAKEGFAVSTATDGQEAVKAMLRRPPDLVLLDLMLPGLDGLEVCRLAGARNLFMFHHNPERDDQDLAQLFPPEAWS